MQRFQSRAGITADIKDLPGIPAKQQGLSRPCTAGPVKHREHVGQLEKSSQFLVSLAPQGVFGEEGHLHPHGSGPLNLASWRHRLIPSRYRQASETENTPHAHQGRVNGESANSCLANVLTDCGLGARTVGDQGILRFFHRAGMKCGSLDQACGAGIVDFGVGELRVAVHFKAAVSS